jgi:hypothetical protein
MKTPSISLKAAFGIVVSVAVGISAVIGAWFALDSVGLRPAFNNEVQAAEERVVEQVAGLEEFSISTRILALQSDRRYWQAELDDATDEVDRNPGNDFARDRQRTARESLEEIRRQLQFYRAKQAAEP